MRLVDALGVGEESRRIAVVGSGGKTTLVFRLATELRPPVIVTTTTHLSAEQSLWGNRLVFSDNLMDNNLVWDGITVVCKSQIINGRRSGPDPDEMVILKNISCDYSAPLLIEADGSRGLPLKAPADHEPAIPTDVEVVIVVVGLNCLGKQIGAENVLRHEKFCEITGANEGDLITPELLGRYLSDPDGALKNIPASSIKILFLNQADNETLVTAARVIGQKLKQCYERILIGKLASEDPSNEVVEVIERTAGIIMAAGASRRLGSPKQLAEWNGIPLLRHVILKVLEAKLDEIIVVVGYESKLITECIFDLPVKIVDNTDWENGQSTSIRAGINYLSQKNSGSVIFFPCDQPFISPEIIHALVQTRSKCNYSIISPSVNKTPTSPVLFGFELFDNLLLLTGDQGGKKLFSTHPVNYIEWSDERLLLDLDTKEDYAKLTMMLRDNHER